MINNVYLFVINLEKIILKNFYVYKIKQSKIILNLLRTRIKWNYINFVFQDVKFKQNIFKNNIKIFK